MYNGVQPDMYYTNSTYPVTGGPLLGDFCIFCLHNAGNNSSFGSQCGQGQ